MGFWTLELATKLEDAPWPATIAELLDYANRSGAPLEVIENLQEMEEEGEVSEIYENIETFGQTIQVKMISSSTRRSINFFRKTNVIIGRTRENLSCQLCL